MLKKILLALVILLTGFTAFSQSNPVLVAKSLHISKDSTELLRSLNGFLEQLSKPDMENSFASKEAFTTTATLMDEIKPATANHAFKSWLTNVTELESGTYLLQLDYLGIKEADPLLQVSCKFIAKKNNGQFDFCSPLKRNTLTWHAKKVSNFIIYRNTENKVDKLDAYVSYAMAFDKKLQAPDYPTEVYYCDNFTELMSLLGLTYRAEFGGISSASVATYEDKHCLYLIGAVPTYQPAFDPHDLWHSRMHHVVNTDLINRPLDEACAYLYGGSWGISWPDIFAKFKAFKGNDQNWLASFNAHEKFGDPVHAPLYSDYVIAALLIQKIEKEKGFTAVIRLVTCGKKEADNANFFKALKEIAGIDQANFNTVVQRLITAQAK